MAVGAAQAMQSLLLAHGLSSQDEGARSLVVEHLQPTEAELDEFFGHGPLTSLLSDSLVTEVLVNGHQEIWYEKAGVLQPLDAAFSDEEAVMRYVRRLLAPQHRKVDPFWPFANACLPNGWRVHVAAPPAAKKGLCISLRKFPDLPWSLEGFLCAGTLSASVQRLLTNAVMQKKNILVCGATGSGKTSLLGALLGEVDASERIIALEDVAEIRTKHPHFLALEGRPPNQEGEGEISIRQLLRESLRMRPDRIVVGECRGAEALDLLLALNTGHAGSFATIHANAPREALARLETLALLADVGLSERAVQSLVAGAVQLVVQLTRDKAGRRVKAIAELKGIDEGTYLLREVLV